MRQEKFYKSRMAMIGCQHDLSPPFRPKHQEGEEGGKQWPDYRPYGWSCSPIALRVELGGRRQFGPGGLRRRCGWQRRQFPVGLWSLVKKSWQKDFRLAGWLQDLSSEPGSEAKDSVGRKRLESWNWSAHFFLIGPGSGWSHCVSTEYILLYVLTVSTYVP